MNVSTCSKSPAAVASLFNI